MNSGGQSHTNRNLDLLHELDNEEYRRGFVEGLAKDTIAFQIRQLRKAEGWEQRDLARELGNPKLQPMISRYENPDYGRYSITTLLELAAVFDVALVVRFAPISELVEWDWNTTAQTLAPASYSKDKRLSLLAKRAEDPNASMGELANLASMGKRSGDDRPVKPGVAALGGGPKSQIANIGRLHRESPNERERKEGSTSTGANAEIVGEHKARPSQATEIGCFCSKTQEEMRLTSMTGRSGKS